MKKRVFGYLILAGVIAAGVTVGIRMRHAAHGCHDDHGHDCDHAHGADKQHTAIGKITHDHSHSSACAHGHEHGDDAQCEGTDASESFELSAYREKLLGIRLTEARGHSLRDIVTMPGRFEWDQNAVRSYGVPVAGFVEMYVAVPQPVKKGDALFSLDSLELLRMTQDAELADRSLDLIATAIEVLERRIATFKMTGSRNAELEMELTLRKAELDQAAFQRDALTNLLREIIPAGSLMENGRVVVRALDDGFVKDVAGVSGAWRERGGELVRTVRSGGLRFKAEALFADASVLSNGLAGEVHTANSASGTNTVTGIVAMGFAGSADARSMPVYVDFDQMPPWVKPSMPGTLRVVVRESDSDTVVVPANCVIESGLSQLVFVADSTTAGRYHIRRVEIGVREGDAVEVISGLHSGERVVSSGAYQLRWEFAGGESADRPVAGHYHADGEFHTGEH